MRDANEGPRPLPDRLPVERRNANFGDDVMHVVTRCHDAGALTQHWHDAADGAPFSRRDKGDNEVSTSGNIRD